MEAEWTGPRKSKRKRGRWPIVVVVVLVLAAGAFFVINRVNQGRDSLAAAQAQTGDIVNVTVGELSASATATGQVEPVQTARLTANTPGVVETVFIQVGDTVQTGDVLVQLATDDLALAVARAQQNLTLQEANLASLLAGSRVEDIVAAEAAVNSAQVSLDNLLAGPSAQEIAESEANIRTQEAGVASAAASYNSTLETVTASAIAAAEADVLTAQIAYDNAWEINDDFANDSTHASLEAAAEDLAIAQAALAELLDGPNQGNLNSASAGISAAVANREQAEANFDQLLTGPTAAQIAAAEATLAQAKSNLANLLNPSSAENIAIAEANVTQAQLSLLDAEEALAKATITAPFAGLITAVSVAEGETANGTVVELTSSALQVVLSVDEIDVGTLTRGQQAIIALETWPETDIASELVSIAPTANNGNGIVSYDVTLAMADSELPVLVGMTANARLITANRDDVLLIPNAAITADRQAGTYSVNRVTGENDGIPTTETVEITIGLRDGDFTEVTDGLAAGDEVIIGELVAPIQGFGPGGGGPFGDNDN